MGNKNFLKSSLIIAAAATTTLAFIPKVNAATTGVAFDAHVQRQGWIASFGAKDSLSNAVFGGTIGQSLRLEAVKIRMLNKPANVKLSYRAHIQTYGWQDWVDEGEQAGTTGEGKRMEAIELSVEGNEDYVVRYRAHVQNYGWQPWIEATNSKSDKKVTPDKGKFAGTIGESKRMEALEIVFVSKAENDLLTKKENAIAELVNKYPPTKYTINKEDYDKTIEQAKSAIYKATNAAAVETALNKYAPDNGLKKDGSTLVKNDEAQIKAANDAKKAAIDNLEDTSTGYLKNLNTKITEGNTKYIDDDKIKAAVETAKKAIQDAKTYDTDKIDKLVKQQKATIFNEVKQAMKALLEAKYKANDTITDTSKNILTDNNYKKGLEDIETVALVDANDPKDTDIQALVTAYSRITFTTLSNAQTNLKAELEASSGIISTNLLGKALNKKDTKNQSGAISEKLGLIVGETKESTYKDITEIKKVLEAGNLAFNDAQTYTQMKSAVDTTKSNALTQLKAYMEKVIKGITNNKSTNELNAEITETIINGAAKYNTYKDTTDPDHMKDLIDAFDSEIMEKIDGEQSE